MKKIKHFLDLDQIDAKELRSIIDLSKSYKQGITSGQDIFKEKTLGLIFEKPSTRTRVSFEIAMYQLGGNVTILEHEKTHLGRGEAISDTAKVLARYIDIIVYRTSSAEKLYELAKHSSIPVINGLTDLTHPCQVMADMLTIEESKGKIHNQDIIWLGDGNNVARSWVEASEISKINLTICTPENLSLPRDLIKDAIAKGAKVSIDNNPENAVKNKNVVITDTWNSMGDGTVNNENSLKPYQVNKKLMKLASKEAVFMHCLPAHRGHEVTAEVIDSKQSLVFLGAENRMHVQRSIIWWCLNND